MIFNLAEWRGFQVPCFETRTDLGRAFKEAAHDGFDVFFDTI